MTDPQSLPDGREDRLATFSILPDHPPTLRHLDPASALAFRTPLQEHPPAADAKATAILAAFGLMIPLLTNVAKLEPRIPAALATPTAFGVLLWISLLGFAALALGAMTQSLRTISPRFPVAPASLAFFADIASLPREEYIRRVRSLTHEEALDQLLSYNHTLATICVEKFRHLRRAVRLFRWSFAVWLAILVIVVLFSRGFG